MEEPPILRARLLGSLDLRLGDRSLPPLDSARAESLLAYLLLHRDAPQPRQRLAFLLWPDSTEAQARTNLRKVLHVLRNALPDPDRLIETGQRTLRWRADAALWLDVAQFEQALTDGRFEDAVEIYAGDLLEGNYDEWLLEERERLARMHLEALERLSRSNADQRRWPDAIRFAERLVAHDPLREESHRRDREARGTGRRSTARRADWENAVVASAARASAWTDPADANRMIADTRTFARAMSAFSTGASNLNFTHEPDRVREAYGDTKYARLVALKDRYDPGNLFRLNQNIRPSRVSA
jgi:DNA-binding SARP family transcriptional activator